MKTKPMSTTNKVSLPLILLTLAIFAVPTWAEGGGLRAATENKILHGERQLTAPFCQSHMDCSSDEICNDSGLCQSCGDGGTAQKVGRLGFCHFLPSTPITFQEAKDFCEHSSLDLKLLQIRTVEKQLATESFCDTSCSWLDLSCRANTACLDDLNLWQYLPGGALMTADYHGFRTQDDGSIQSAAQFSAQNESVCAQWWSTEPTKAPWQPQICNSAASTGIVCEPASQTVLGAKHHKSHMAVCGSQHMCHLDPTESDNSELHEVRCCSDSFLSGWKKRSGCDVWAESDPKDSNEQAKCFHSKTYGEAFNICKSFGARLCTQEELQMDCTRGTGCMHDLDLIWSSSNGDSPAALMFDQMAKFGTQDEAATYASTTTTTFPNLFSCSKEDYGLFESQNAAWLGFVEYAVNSSKSVIQIPGAGQYLTIEDSWGTRCSDPNAPYCGDRYSECDDPDTCVPEILEFPSEGEVNDIPIYEPCNFLSNLAFYRAMPQVCGSSVYMEQEESDALAHAFAALGFGSAFWHGSHTVLGNRADVVMIGIVAYIDYQLMIKGLTAASGYNSCTDKDDWVDSKWRNCDWYGASSLRCSECGHKFKNSGMTANEACCVCALDGVDELMDLAAEPRSKTAAQTAAGVTNMLASSDVSTWTQQLMSLDIPAYELTFSVLIGTAISTIFPDRPDTVAAILDGLSSIMGADSTALNEEYLPTIRRLVGNVNLSNDEKFILFRQLIGVGSKMIFAFLWQEQVIQSEFFLKHSTNEEGAKILEPLYKVFNFISGFQHTDATFQTFEGMYPGAEECRPTQPHAKWHECAANGLLDMSYLSDCVAAIASGSSKCAQLASFDGLGEITLAQFNALVSSIIPDPDFPFVKELIEGFFTMIFIAFDTNHDNKIDWTDIDVYVNKIENAIQVVQDIIDGIQQFMKLFDLIECSKPLTSGTSSGCSSGQYCNALLQCHDKKDNGESCLLGYECSGGACSDVVGGKCKTGCSSDSDCPGEDFCGVNTQDKFCKTPKPNGATCDRDAQCENYCSGIICADCHSPLTSGTSSGCNPGQYCNGLSQCKDKKNNGASCQFGYECSGGACSDIVGGKCKTGCSSDSDCPGDDFCGVNTQDKFCKAPKSNGATCTRDAQCQNSCVGLICAGCHSSFTSGTPSGCNSGQYCNGLYECKNKKNKGTGCGGDHECHSGDCGVVCQAWPPNCWTRCK